MNIVHPNKSDIGIVGSMPTFFWGEMYANFGYVGVVIPPVFIGILTYWFNVQLFRLSPSPIPIAFFLWFVMHYKDLAITSLSGFIVDFEGVIILFTLAASMFFIGRGSIAYQRHKCE